MYISKIRLKNYTSFEELELDLNPLSIFIGANNTGKSNLLKLFKFLKINLEIDKGINEAVDEVFFGWNNFHNRQSKDDFVEIDITFDEVL